MDNATKASFLKDEYLLLQRVYEDFDSRAMTIKGWSATIAIAAIGAGFYQTRYLWLFAAAASLVFWILESVWKSFQYLYAPRIQAIERAFREDRFDDIAPLQVYETWFDAYRARGIKASNVLRLGIVWFPHLVTLVAGILLFALESFHLFTSNRAK